MRDTAGMAVVGEVARARPGVESWGDIAGIVSTSGGGFRVCLLLEFETSAILGIVNKMLCESYSALDAQVADAVSELTNMLLGTLKRSLSGAGLKLEPAIPRVVCGRGVPLRELEGRAFSVLPFRTGHGEIRLGYGLFSGDAPLH